MAREREVGTVWMPVTLVTKVTGIDEGTGIPASSTSTAEVYGRMDSVRRTEYYSAMKSGEQPTTMFTLWLAEFRDASVKTEAGKLFEPTELVCDDVRYKIGRTHYKTGSDYIELTCTKIM